MTLTDSRCGALFVGLATVDLVHLVHDIPGRNAKVAVTGQQVFAGGPATNAAVTFAALGGRSNLVTAVGQHPLAAIICDEMRNFSVDLHDMAADQVAPPPVSSIMVVRETGERTVVSATNTVFPQTSLEVAPRWFDDIGIMLVDGQYMALCIAAAQLGRSRKIPVVLDSGSWKAGMDGLLPHVDIAICSDDFRPPNCLNDGDAAKFLIGSGIGRVAITRGAAPIRFWQDGVAGDIPVEQVRARDTLGAGDIFHGAFCYSMCRGQTFTDALTFAAQVATFSCRHLGTRGWIESFPATARRG